MTDNQVAKEFAIRMVNFIGISVALILVVVGIILGRRSMRKPKQIPLAPDEKRLGEMYGKTRDVTLGGFIAAGSAFEGKLVLTSKRLVYTRYDEKHHAFTISPNDLIGVKVEDISLNDLIGLKVEEKGMLAKKPTLRITFSCGARRKPKTVTWLVPEKVTVAGNTLVFMGDKSYDNPNTATTFAALLERWRAGTA